MAQPAASGRPASAGHGPDAATLLAFTAGRARPRVIRAPGVRPRRRSPSPHAIPRRHGLEPRRPGHRRDTARSNPPPPRPAHRLRFRRAIVLVQVRRIGQIETRPRRHAVRSAPPRDPVGAAGRAGGPRSRPAVLIAALAVALFFAFAGYHAAGPGSAPAGHAAPPIASAPAEPGSSAGATNGDGPEPGPADADANGPDPGTGDGRQPAAPAGDGTTADTPEHAPAGDDAGIKAPSTGGDLPEGGTDETSDPHVPADEPAGSGEDATVPEEGETPHLPVPTTTPSIDPSGENGDCAGEPVLDGNC